MKKKIVRSLLALVLSVVVIGAGVSRVAADAEPGMETEDTAVTTETEEAEQESDSAETGEEIQEEEDEEVSEEIISESEEDTEAESEPEIEITGMKVTIENTLAEAVVAVQVANLMEEAYSDNLLPERMKAETGKEFVFGIPEEIQDNELGIYNVLITLESGTVKELPFVPFLDQVEGVLYEENGTTLIRIRDKRLEADAEPVSESEIFQREAEASQIMAEALVEEIE